MIASARPIPAFLTEGAGADRGLICGYRIIQGQFPQEIAVERLVESLSRGGITWLHFNLSETRARRWLLDSEFLPLTLREILNDHDANRRIEWTDDGLLLVLNDFTFEDVADPSDVAPLWSFARGDLLITARMHPLKSADDLRLSMRDRSSAASGFELVTQLLQLRTRHLRRRVEKMVDLLDDIEDEILAGNVHEQREQLGRTRRVCARWRRSFAPERSDLGKFLQREQAQFSPGDATALHEESESLRFTLEEIAEIYERAKLLQEELAARLAETTSRNLYVLSILTAVLLPMTLVTGIFGMNVAGMPGLHDAAAFWRVMFLVVASGVVTLVGFIWRRFL
ncbi:MAG: CorA family divalent cation transporter [Povalibacter sp.]